MRFEYTARDPLGNSLDGMLEALDRDDAAAKLRRDGLHILTLEQADGGFALFNKPIRKSDVIYATSQLAVMVDTGIPLSSALASIASQEENPTFRLVLSDLKTRVEAGEDFSAALARYPNQFDRTYTSLIKASEQTGQLAEMLDSIANYQRGQLETRQKVRAALTYPAIMAAVAVTVTIFLLTYILPKFAPLFSRKGVKLPLITKYMIIISDSMLQYWWAYLGAFVAIGMLYVFGKKTDFGRKIIDWLTINTPLIGTTCRKVILSRSIRTLATMIKSGVSMLDAVKLTGQVSGNSFYEQAWQKVLNEITEGNRIYDGLKGNPLFPGTLLQMIVAGEETAKLDEVLNKVSAYYDREVETAIKSTTSLIEPCLIVVMGAVVSTIAMGLLLPIFSLSRGGG